MTILTGATILTGCLAILIGYGLLIKLFGSPELKISKKEKQAFSEFEEAMERWENLSPGHKP